MRTVLCALAAAAALAALRPARAFGTLDMDDAGNRTVCPVVTVVDEEPHRRPRLIKTWRCAPDPLGVCRARGLPDADCCHGHYDGPYAFECVELTDSTRVAREVKELDIVRTEWSWLEVPVGCACMVHEVPAAVDLPSGPERRSGALGPGGREGEITVEE